MGCKSVRVQGNRAFGVLISASVALVLFVSPATAGQSPGLGQAKAALLVKSDFPSGWSAQGSVKTSHGGGVASFFGSSQAQDQLANCLGASSTLMGLNPPAVTSPNFQFQGGAWLVQDNVSIFPNAKLAQQTYVLFTSAKTPACLAAALQGPARNGLVADFGKGATVGTITATAPNPLWLVPHSGGFTISLPVTIQGTTTTVVSTFLVMVRGRMAHEVSFTSVIPKPFSASLAHHLAATAYTRI